MKFKVDLERIDMDNIAECQWDKNSCSIKIFEMANGLFCSESLTVSPKLRHVSNDSNSENTPPELLAASGQHCHLLCHEIIDEKELRRGSHYQQQPFKHITENYHHPPVESKIDPYLLHDDRVLQNLLRNEERYVSCMWEDYSYKVWYFVDISRAIRTISPSSKLRSSLTCGSLWLVGCLTCVTTPVKILLRSSLCQSTFLTGSWLCAGCRHDTDILQILPMFLFLGSPPISSSC